MGREIRRVPKNWEHPKRNGKYKPLNDDYIGILKYYKEDYEKFISYMTEIIQKGKVKVYDKVWEDPNQLYTYLTEDGQLTPPDIHDYMPNGEWYQLFENVSEGTPLSPAFSTKEELVDWLTHNVDYWDHQWTPEQAKAMVEQEYAPSGIMTGGKFYSAEESVLLPK